MQTIDFVENKEAREKYITRTEVLDRVKELFLMPKLEMMTTQQVADYYEVKLDAIKRCYQRNHEEIEQDGMARVTSKHLDFLKEQLVPLEKSKGYQVFQLSDDVSIRIPNRGIYMFPKRAILRIGMLLRDSAIAQEVRTQLLNTVEHVDPQITVREIENEQSILGEMALAFADGDIQGFAQAAMKYSAYQNRHIAELENNNKALAKEILEWTTPQSVNKAIRIIASMTHMQFGVVWSKLYDELLYRHHISLRSRGKAPYLRYVKENEWPLVQQSLCAICENNGVSPTHVFERAKLVSGD